MKTGLVCEPEWNVATVPCRFFQQKRLLLCALTAAKKPLVIGIVTPSRDGKACRLRLTSFLWSCQLLVYVVLSQGLLILGRRRSDGSVHFITLSSLLMSPELVMRTKKHSSTLTRLPGVLKEDIMNALILDAFMLGPLSQLKAASQEFICAAPFMPCGHLKRFTNEEVQRPPK
ncbi:hypothetical protein AOLI_G00014310 [Acnodon oligacanthus]